MQSNLNQVVVIDSGTGLSLERGVMAEVYEGGILRECVAVVRFPDSGGVPLSRVRVCVA